MPRHQGGEAASSASIALLFLLSGLFALGVRGRLHLVAVASTSSAPTTAKSTPRCSASPSALAAARSASAILTWGKKLLPEEISIQDRHDGPSPPTSSSSPARRCVYMVDELGMERRPLLKAAIAAAGLAPLGVAAAAPLSAA